MPSFPQVPIFIQTSATKHCTPGWKQSRPHNIISPSLALHERVYEPVQVCAELACSRQGKVSGDPDPISDVHG